MRSEFLIVAKRLMERERRAMSVRDMVDLGLKRQLFSDDVAGQTPHKTMGSKLSVHIRRLGDQSLFVRTGPGKFYLRSLLNGAAPFEVRPAIPPPSVERVLAFRREELDRLTSWQGLKTAWRQFATEVFSRLKPLYIPRIEAEQRTDLKQVTTYVLVANHQSLLAYKRGTYSRVEQFLQGSSCIGFGGHVTDVDLDLFNIPTMGVYACASRELMEELRIPFADKKRLSLSQGLTIEGVINDDSSEVGRRHLAFVLKYNVANPADWTQPERGEKAITQLHWISPQNPSPVGIWNFEYWSQLCLRNFAPTLTRTSSAYRLIRRKPLIPPHVLCVIGPVGSGKTLATETLKTHYGYSEVNTGRIMANLLGIPPVPKTQRQIFQAKALRFISRVRGPGILAKEIWKAISQTGSDRVLVDGLRHKSTLQALRHLKPHVKVGVLFVHTPPDLAYGFYSQRIEHGSTMPEFVSVRSAPVEAEVESLISDADVVLYNWTGRLQYARTIIALMKDLGVMQRPLFHTVTLTA